MTAVTRRMTARSPAARTNRYDPPTIAPSRLVTPAPDCTQSPIDHLEALDEHGHALPAANAHRLEPDRLVERLEIVQQRAHDPGAGHAVGVPERDRAAVRIQLLAERIDAELPAHRQ